MKRVELHCHTKMSDMDGVSDVKDIIKRAMKWGHKAIAITDHGDVQAFPDANHAIGKDDDFKIIYGMEAYLVDDLKGLVEHPMGQSFADTFVVFDLETTGFSPSKNQIIEIGAVKVLNGSITERFSTFVNPKVPIPFEIEQLTSINDDMVLDAPTIDEILPKFMEFCQDAVMVAHNADFDMSFIKHNCSALGLECEKTVLDTVALSRVLLPALNRFKLDTVAKALNVSLAHHHRAVDDAACTAEIFVKLVEMLRDRGVETMEDLDQMESYTEETIRKMPSYHAIMLAQNDIGRVNLYRLVSDSHIKYYNRRPKIPKSEFMKYREGILLGSACEAGELYRTLLRGSSQEEVARIVQFYDYLEIQPLGNNAFMLRTDKEPVESEEDLKDINRQIVELGEQFNKLVVATCDVHFLDPEDEVYRRIIMAGKGFKDADDQAPLFLRTTEEMLKEFEYLGSEKAEEVVIENTNKIANMCEKISPVRPDKCPPVIENSDGMLREICYTRAHEIYGEDLPPVVVERLERELNSIISNGFAVMYIIAQKLVWKSNEDGYLVGSRGSVGSSFVATMAGITEVNPLSPHYICSNCHYVDFDSDLVKSYAGKAGCDMPDRNCPHCGQKLIKEGFDIPFETFLGFKGNKEPDIDLNFSGDYQSKAHKYTEVIFGDGQTFRAGTIGTLADKTAFGYVKNYYEERGVHKRNCEIDRIVQGCVGVRRTTGQHPGGIIVLPLGENIYSFTPVQHPANDMSTDIITTHFDYHSIDHNLLKLDILGHDDPTMIRMLQDLTGVDPQTIPLDSPEVMSLFQNTSALGIEPEDIGGCKLGALGIPEFGTDFAMQMLIDTKPQAFSDLVRIAGLSHGTDVWLGNAQTLIQEGKATISTAICTRDDIMMVNAGEQTLDDTYIVFDIETTGFSAIKDKIIEIGAVKVKDGAIVEKFSTFVNPKRPIPFEITQLTSITDEMVLDAPDIESVLPEFLEFVGDGVLVAHNAGFDVGFIEQNCRYQEIEPDFVSVDTVALARVLLPTLSKYKLNIVAKALGISLENHHRAVDDAGATAEIFVKFVEMLKDRNITTLKEMNRFGDMNVNAIRKLPTHHIIILVKNDIGRFNLYQLISASHLTYFARRPRIPKSLLNQHREGLIIGSACEAGELYQAILNQKSPQAVARLAVFMIIMKSTSWKQPVYDRQ